MKFGSETDSLLVEKSDATTYKLICPTTGEEVDLTDEDTLLANGNVSDKYYLQIYKNVITTMAKNPIMPRIRHDCDKCGIKIVSYFRIPTTSIVIMNCMCGNVWRKL